MSVATSYAKALYEAAVENQSSPDSLDQIQSQLDAFVSMLEQSPGAKTALIGPIATFREKTVLIEELAKKMAISTLLTRFLILLVKKRRLVLLSKIRDSFSAVRLTLEGGLAGQLVAAEALSEEDMSSLAKAFSNKFGKKVAFRVSNDPSLLAGMKVTVNGVTYDGTLRSQLQKLRDRFVAGFAGSA